MKKELESLANRLRKDIDSMPWQDKGMRPEQLKSSVAFFINVFLDDLQKEQSND